MSMEKSHWRLQPHNWPSQPSGKTWANHYIQVANRTLWPASAPEANWHHGLCTLRLQRSRTDGPPHPPGLSHPAETETPVMAAGWVNHQQAVGNSGRPAPHHTIPGNMWTEGLSTADRPQKKKKVLSLPSLPAWRADYTCHHSHRLNEPAAKGGVWTGLPWLAHSHAQSSATKTSVDLLSWARRSQWEWTGR